MIAIEIVKVNLVDRNCAKVTFTSPERKSKEIGKYTKWQGFLFQRCAQRWSAGKKPLGQS
jgi:hypothetical protein